MGELVVLCNLTDQFRAAILNSIYANDIIRRARGQQFSVVVELHIMLRVNPGCDACTIMSPCFVSMVIVFLLMVVKR